MGKDWVIKPGLQSTETYIGAYRELVDKYVETIPADHHATVMNVDFWAVYFIVSETAESMPIYKDVALLDGSEYKMLPRNLAEKLANAYLVHMHYLAEARDKLGMNKGE